jgi:hypothetical protein
MEEGNEECSDDDGNDASDTECNTNSLVVGEVNFR